MLIHHGYLGCSPLFPTVATSICTLTAYRQAQCKVLSLNCDSLNWRLLNSCPCCFYKLEDEENMSLEWLVTMDSNNSLKRWMSSTARNDSCTFRSDYWLDRLRVDKFKDEVRGHTHPTADTENGQDIKQTETVPSSSFTCVNQWRNAGPEQRKRMFSVFDESGIFIAACRHWFILLACDMVKSGELAEYPLAVVDQLLTVYGKNGGCAYNIGCAFAKMLGNSTLGPRASTLNLRIMVGATRHATTFHQHQSIEQHFTFWDEDKYTALSVFIWNHYREALADIQTLTAELSVIWETLNLTDADFIRFHAQEREYLDGLKQAPVKDLVSIRYVNVLDKLAERHLSHMHLALNQARVRVDTAYSKLQNTEQLAGYLEVQLGIDKHWEIRGEHYNCFREEALLLRYCSVLDELERLFELSKLSLSGTDAIRNTINHYNTQAAALVPPRPKLMWKDIVEYSFLGEFDLLRHSRTDIRDVEWTTPAHWEATVKYFKLQCAREEIQCLNIEICRLRTAIHDEETKTIATIDQLLITNSLLAMELRRRWQARATVNAVHLYRLSRIESQPAFSGRCGIGV
ncbi:uncharacterized protein F5891DRAFT_1131069 [Suillus fuscotomentosus]|uniref:Uncharacterized protein n=1 Tax=Suillus fuscotomentosus TaxID=1912939 RepID=A0AAD4DU53_9AGAM|nr:uncharacterized protein F5891DRAFT_1131069 [Suillus fuscotomentosus]KAG1893995.1 hypothetical protein F5891DRAFT_1131069 [Suillus fuscotomentosus]